jgi:predicted secreted protein
MQHPPHGPALPPLLIAGLALLAASAGCRMPAPARTEPPARIPVLTAATAQAPRGVLFAVSPEVGDDAPSDWELHFEIDGEPVELLPTERDDKERRLPVPFGNHTVQAVVTEFKMVAETSTQMVPVQVQTSVPCATGTCLQTTTQMQPRTVTTMVRRPVGSCTALTEVAVQYEEARRLVVPIRLQRCAVEDRPISPY